MLTRRAPRCAWVRAGDLRPQHLRDDREERVEDSEPEAEGGQEEQEIAVPEEDPEVTEQLSQHLGGGFVAPAPPGPTTRGHGEGPVRRPGEADAGAARPHQVGVLLTAPLWDVWVSWAECEVCVLMGERVSVKARSAEREQKRVHKTDQAPQQSAQGQGLFESLCRS